MSGTTATDAAAVGAAQKSACLSTPTLGLGAKVSDEVQSCKSQTSCPEQPGIDDHLVLTHFWVGLEQSSMTIF